ncbi:TadE/TadG family type IV pilus assembly protein [Sphingobium aquiterrae]|uniref:TadE/TadG family type IV pilus assembly protein n=1 Tax=Sphingobium aquiterrae TaxID=2038656 RepID=UPI00301AAEBE
MTRRARHLLRDSRASSAAEFALVLPLLLIFLFGIIDVGRLMWTWNRAEKATQMGVRYAVVTDMVPTGLANYSFATSGGIPQGDTIPLSAFGGASCTSTSCTCHSGATCPTLTPYNGTAFTKIVDRMRLFMPEIAASDVKVDYGYSGLGYAGDPNGSDVAPVVTVSLLPGSIQFQPITLILFQTSFGLPSFGAALTLEDAKGSASN